MKLVVRLVALGLLGVLLLLVAWRGRSVERPASPEVARVGDDSIHLVDLELRIGAMPPAARASLEEPEHRRELLDHLIDELLLTRAAESMGLDREPEFRAVLADARRQLLANIYRERVLRPRAQPDSAYIERYYDEHPEEFRVAERVTGRQIVLATEREAREVRDRLLEGVPLDSLLERSIDETTRNLGGSIGVVSRGAPVRGLGADESFVEAVMALDEGEISEPIATKLGYHVVVIESHQPGRVRPLETVWESLSRRLYPVRFREIQAATLDSLRRRNAVEVDEEALYGEDRYHVEQAKRLFERAQETADAEERLSIYQQILDLDVDERYAAQARFMRGFVYIEELGDRERGRAELEQLLRDHPGSDLVDSARWMLDNDDGREPEDPAAPAPTGGTAETGDVTP